MGNERFDGDGFLNDPGSWDEERARNLAGEEGIGELSEEHWAIIRFLREHYSNGGLPAVSHVCHVNHFENQCVPDLFLSVKAASRIAGLPDPGEEAKIYIKTQLPSGIASITITEGLPTAANQPVVQAKRAKYTGSGNASRCWAHPHFPYAKLMQSNKRSHAMKFHPSSGSITLILFVTLFPTCVAAEDSYAKITFPPDGAKLDAFSQNRIDYEVNPGARGSHIHLYVDNKEAAILRKLSGSHSLESLQTGAHSLCIKVVNKAHVPIGVEQCIKVNVE